MKNQFSFTLIMLLLLTACQTEKKGNGDKQNKPILTVTIEPLRYFTEAIAGEHFSVVSMVPKGSSPESYDPTPQQLIELERSKAYLRIGYIGFELAWMEKLADNVPHLPIYDLSKGIDLIEEPLPDSPSRKGTENGKHETDSLNVKHSSPSSSSGVEEGHHHHGGVEPHIWNSALNASLIADNILHALCEIDSKNCEYYKTRHDSLIHRLEQTDSLLCARLSTSEADRAFMIYHPALSYFARDYGLRQIPIENAGKEPSVATLQELIKTCKKEKVRVVFVQPEFDRRNAEIIAKEAGAQVVPINPLAYDWEKEMIRTAEALSPSSAPSSIEEE